MAKSVEEAKASMAQNLEQKTGKSLADWVKIARASKLAKHKEITTYLKAEHGLTHGYANFVALQALQPEGQAPPAGNELIDTQYAGAKASLRPIYDALIALVSKFGNDIEIAPKKAYVSLRRNKQFAIIQPSTASRVDVGINLKGTAPTEHGKPRMKPVWSADQKCKPLYLLNNCVFIFQNYHFYVQCGPKIYRMLVSTVPPDGPSRRARSRVALWNLWPLGFPRARSTTSPSARYVGARIMRRREEAKCAAMPRERSWLRAT